ncbi:MAG TPA: rod shape-determining protein MreC [Firmicutes bacterium]|nr:rod shape-determining protein MreC [Bacillota bacterium]
MSRFTRHRWLVVYTIAVLLAFVLVARTSREPERPGFISKVIVGIAMPFQRAANRVTQAIEGVRDWGSSLVMRKQEIQVLKDKADQLTAMEARVTQLEQEVDRLRSLLSYKMDSSVSSVSATVIARHPDNWFAKLYIDRGAADGILKNDMVVTSRGLVGRISAVYPKAARVSLVIDPETETGAMIQRNGEPGLIKGSMSSPKKLYFQLFSRDADVREGDIVVTSGLGVSYPAGVLVGSVRQVRFEENGLIKVAEVIPLVDLNRINEVLVLKPQGRRAEIDMGSLR